MNKKNFFSAVGMLCSVCLFFCVTGCTTRYGYEYCDVSSIQAAPPVHHALQLECKVNRYDMYVNEVQKRTLKDCNYTVRQGEEVYFKDYCTYSEKEMSVLFPCQTAFPCLTWGTTMITGKFPMSEQSNIDYMCDRFGSAVEGWGPMIGFGVIANVLLGAGDLVYHVGGGVWSLLAVPSYYAWNRLTTWGKAWEYRSNSPNWLCTFISLPVINLFAPGYIPPYLNDGPMKSELRPYAAPVQLKEELVRTIPQTLKHEIAPGTVLKIKYDNKEYTVKAGAKGRILLPFKLYPLPARKEQFTVETVLYKSKLAAKPATLKSTVTLNTVELLQPAEVKLYRTAKDSALNFMQRFRAVNLLKNAIRPQDFKKFQSAPDKFSAL